MVNTSDYLISSVLILRIDPAARNIMDQRVDNFQSLTQLRHRIQKLLDDEDVEALCPFVEHGSPNFIAS